MRQRSVLIDEGLSPAISKLFDKTSFTLDVVKLGSRGLAKLINQQGYVALIVRESTRISSEVIAAGSETLKVIGVVGDSLDNLDVSEASKRGIIVKITEYGNTYEAAYLTIKLIAFLQSESFQKRDSEEALIFNKIKSITPEMITGFEFTDKVVGIIGCGRVAQALAAELQPHCQAILGYDEDPRYVYERFHSRNPLVRPRIEYCALPELLERADIITIHTSGPFKVFRGQQLLRAKRKPCIIDTARDGTIDEASLLSALKGKKIRSAALTIPYQQIKHADYTDYVKQLIAFRNVVIAPSLGKPITAAHKKNSLALARAVIAYLLNGDLSLAVNPYAVAGLEERTSYPLSVQGRRGAVPFFLNS